MKTLLLITVLIGSYHWSVAQITITQSNMPSANDTIRYCNAAVNIAFTPSNSGANYTWDFTNLNETSQGLYEYKNSLSTPYFFYFFNKVGLKTAERIGISTIALTDIYTFYTKNNNVFKVEGLGYSYNNIPLANNYVDEDEIYQFPLQYGDRDSSTYYFDYNLSQYTSYIDYAQNGTRVNEVDGWGSLSIPNANYPNVLRVKTIITSYDTITVLNVPLVTNRTSVEYKWLSNTEKIPVLEISGVLLANNYNITSVRYRYHPAIATSVNDNQVSNSLFSVFPNPTDNILNINIYNDKVYNIRLTDVSGKIIIEHPCNQKTSQINTASYAKGIYFIQLCDINKIVLGTQKIIKN